MTKKLFCHFKLHHFQGLNIRQVNFSVLFEIMFFINRLYYANVNRNSHPKFIDSFLYLKNG